MSCAGWKIQPLQRYILTWVNGVKLVFCILGYSGGYHFNRRYYILCDEWIGLPWESVKKEEGGISQAIVHFLWKLKFDKLDVTEENQNSGGVNFNSREM